MKVGIIGASGYAGSELLRLLLMHKNVEVTSISSKNYLGKSIVDLYPSFYQLCDLHFETDEEVLKKCDIIFVSLPHGHSEKYGKYCFEYGKKFIDLGADFRFDQQSDYKEWYQLDYQYEDIHQYQVYGLTEVNREKIKEATLIGNPGCYPTSITLGLYPLLKEKMNKNNHIIIDSKSGTTGAGKSLTEDTHYPRCYSSFHPYKIATHRHTPEIQQELSKINNHHITVTFTPHLLPIHRGILSTIYVDLKEDISFEDVYQTYINTYKNEYFVRVLPKEKTADLKYVQYSNFCDISLHYNPTHHQLVIISVIDNMIKGAAGQAIQNMNVMCGFKESEGLEYIGPSF